MRTYAPLLLAFAVGACSAVAVQSSASAPAESVSTAASWMPPISPIITASADAPRRHPPGNTDVTVTILARGEEAFVAKLEMPSGGQVPMHRDATEEYIHVVEGGGAITVDGTTYEIGPGDTVYMQANAEVSFEGGDTPLVAFQVFAGPEPATKYGAWTPE